MFTGFLRFLYDQVDYVITVKGNQKELHRQIAETFEAFGEDNYRSPKCRSHRTVRTTRGRIEERIHFRIVRESPVAKLAESFDLGRWRHSSFGN